MAPRASATRTSSAGSTRSSRSSSISGTARPRRAARPVFRERLLDEVILSARGAPGTVLAWLMATASFSGLVLGVVGGIYPAWRAAQLQPVEALRYE